MSKTKRYSTRVLAVVHSHVRDDHRSAAPIHLSPDVIAMKTSKAIKGAGGVSLTLVPRRNYFNLVFPNDVINIYVDPGDGKQGFVRTFMGYVDRVERTEVTDDKGGVSTAFRISCTDFQKAFEKTNVYFNPHMENRADLIDQAIGSGTIIGGITLRTLGITAHGSPADMVENLALMLLGFGSQWVLPESYDARAIAVTDNRQRRKNRARARIPNNLLNVFSRHVMDLPSFEGEHFNANSLLALADEENIPSQDLMTLKSGLLTLNAYQRTAKGTATDVYSLIDLIDFSFIEAASIDGYLESAGIWTKQGMLGQLMRAYSNENVNELFFDLRPVAVSRQEGTFSSDSTQYMDSCFGDHYYRGPDELGYNYEDKFEGFGISVPAVAYTPAIVMREYPYSCVDGVDAGSLDSTNTNPLGFVPFGPIFSQKNESSDDDRYRAIYDYREVPEVAEGSLSVSNLGCAFDKNAAPLKHLDVVTIYDNDVVSSSVGRSDSDVFNLYTMYSEDTLIANYKYILKNFMPLVNPVSVSRGGLRVRELTTRFADYGKDVLCEGSPGTKGDQNIRNMIRHLLLIDHWEQHNIEYLSGEITLRGMPEIRVGYRVDWFERRESYYVDSVSHSWNYPKEMTTTIKVSRGQRNDPNPAYIPPSSLSLTATGRANLDGGNRSSDGRLGKFFEVLDTTATSNSTQQQGLVSVPATAGLANAIDQRPSGFSGVTIYSDEKRVRDPNYVHVPPDPAPKNTEVTPDNSELAGDITDGVWPVAIDPVLGEPVVSQRFKQPSLEPGDGSGRTHLGVDIMFRRVTPGDEFDRPERTPNFECTTGNINALCVADGKVWSVKDHPYHGIEVKVDHGAPWLTVYRHLASTVVTKGQVISKGDVLGIVGTSPGNTTTPVNHMHFEIWDTSLGPPAERATMAIDPETMLDTWDKVGV